MIAVTILRNGQPGGGNGLKRPVLKLREARTVSVKSPAVCEGTHAGRSSAHGIAAIRLMAVHVLAAALRPATCGPDDAAALERQLTANPANSAR